MPRILIALSILVALCTPAPLFGQQDDAPRANFAQADRYSSSYLRQRTYSTSVTPKWIGETDRFWYSYRTALGTRYILVDPVAQTKAPLFDHEQLASQLSIAVKKPLDAQNLSLGSAEIDDEGTKLTFVVEKTKFELELATAKLSNLGPAPKEEREPSRRGAPTRRNSEEEDSESQDKDPRAHRNFAPDHTAYAFIQGHDLYYVEASEEVKAEILTIDARMKEEEAAKKKAEEETDAIVDEKQDGEKQDGEKQDGEKQDGEKQDDGKQDDGKQDDGKQDDGKQDDGKQDDEEKNGEEEDGEEEDEVDERELWADDIDESKALRLTDDGEEDYEFSTGRGFRRGAELILDEDAYLESLQAGEYVFPPDGDDEDDEKKEDVDGEEEEEEKSLPRVNWAPDSTAFYVTRRDSRGVEELFLVNSLSEPRPTLESYDYPLPGEENIGRTELHVFDRARKELFAASSKWKDESYQNIHWPKAPEKPDEDDEDAEEPDEAALAGSGDELRFLRRDRLLRNVELCSIDTRNSESKVLLEEGFVGANIAPQSIRYLKERGEMIWWSERTGWGHFYLYDQNGEFKNAITTGPFRASRIVEVDQDKGLLYFRGNGREAGENIYLQHLYRVFLDGTGLTLMDPGNANHTTKLSPTRAYAVDNCSRIDMAPVSRLCDADGNEVMQLEEADLSRLYEAGWTMPETFTFKAADGVTDLYGNMWKPFDFNPKRKYPIIAEVYPGPQTEGVSHSFSSSNGRQQLAQVGFIVVQLGHRGGTPGRSKAYHSYGYFNLRDYGLADKKAGIEQLAERHSFIDIENIGIYGHSGGGFMTAAALMQEPYNDFFTVGVSSSGNHDNNVYGRHWAERYHGLKEVQVENEKKRGDGDAKKKGEEEEKKVTAAQDGKKQKQKQDEGDEKDEKQDGDKDGEDTDEEREDEVTTKFEIHVPTNAELAANLKGHLLLVHGDMDNNVHPAGTMRLVDALIKANKRFDMLIIPGKRHGYGDYNSYFTQRKWEFFAEHLLGDRLTGVDIE